MNKDQAKITLALLAVTRFSSKDENPWTMRELFAPSGKADIDDPVLTRYANQKTWQRDFIQRLIDCGLVEKVQRGTHHVAYKGVEKETLQEIVAECAVENDDLVFGDTIKWFIFPSSYETPEMFRDEDEAEEMNEEPEEDEVALASLRLLTQVSEHLIEIRKSHKDLTDRFGALEISHTKVLEVLPDAIGKSIQAVHDRSFEKLEKEVHAKLDAMAIALSALIDECRKLIANVSMTDKVTDLKSQLNVWNNIIQSIHAQSKDFAAGMETVLDVMEEIEENAAESIR
jgi:hypothetical protein